MLKSTKKAPNPTRFFIALGTSCAVSVALLLARITNTDSLRYIFLIWNLALATLPVFLAWWLVLRVHRFGWLRWQQIILALTWLSFLPNSFYIITDFVHLRPNYEASLYFDVVMIASFVVNGLILGYFSVFLIHRELIKKLSENMAYIIFAGVFLLSSFAIYLGRFTRWNTWDILLQPAGLLFDVSDRFVNPAEHSETFVTTATLFMLLSSVYFIIYEAAKLIEKR